MNKKKIIRIGLIVLGVGILIAGGIGFYLFNMPHRDIQGTETDYHVNASQIVSEYLEDPASSNKKYLSEEGESKIFEVSGEVASIDVDYNNQLVVLLKSPGEQAGVSCTFNSGINKENSGIIEGQMITVKGVIRAGASYDEDMGMYEHVILEKCSLIKQG